MTFVLNWAITGPKGMSAQRCVYKACSGNYFSGRSSRLDILLSAMSNIGLLLKHGRYSSALENVLPAFSPPCCPARPGASMPDKQLPERTGRVSIISSREGKFVKIRYDLTNSAFYCQREMLDLYPRCVRQLIFSGLAQALTFASYAIHPQPQPQPQNCTDIQPYDTVTQFE